MYFRVTEYFSVFYCTLVYLCIWTIWQRVETLQAVALKDENKSLSWSKFVDKLVRVAFNCVLHMLAYLTASNIFG